MVNSIYCGNAADNLAPAWREVAKLADGQFAAIDQNHGTVQIATPFDDDLARLSRSLNATYIPIGAAGRAGILNQIAQDKNATGLSLETAARRGQSKASGIYVCGWCLVDATRNKSVKLVDVKDEDLPVEMRGWTMLKKQQHVDTTYAKRVEIQKQIQELNKKQIQELNKKRQQYVRKEMAKKDASDDQAFDRAVRDALRSQAKKKGYRFEE